MSTNQPDTTWRLATGGYPTLDIPSTKYKLVDSSGDFSQEEASAKEVYIMRAANLLNFATESMPPPYGWLTTIFYPPARALPGLPALRTKRISWKGNVDGKPVDPFGFDPTAPIDTYQEDVEVTVDYSTSKLPDPDDPQTYLDITASSGMEFLNSPTGRGKMLWWGAGEEVKEGDVPFVVKSFETDWDIQWGGIPRAYFNSTLVNTMRSRIGAVNDGAIEFLGNPPPETILFVGMSVQTRYTWQGGDTVTLSLKYVEKNFKHGGVQVTHNHMWNPDKQKWEGLQIDGNPIYELMDLEGMFLPA